MPSLKNLDISYNGLLGYELSQVLDSLMHEGGCKIKTLNLSGNNAVPFEYRGQNGQLIERFSDRMQKLLKSSLSLQHLDLSLLNLDH